MSAQRLPAPSSSRSPSAPAALATSCLLAALAATMPGQQTPVTQPAGQSPAGVGQEPVPGTGQPGGQTQPKVDPEGLTPVWVTPSQPGFTGFPVFPSRLSGYGNYPLSGQTGELGDDPSAVLPGVLLPPAEPEPPGWPAWIRTQAKKPLPFADDLGLLVRDADRVWWRAAPGEAFVPLFFHDKFVTLPVGGEVEVRQVGEFQLLLQATTRIETRGPTAVRLGEMDEESVQVDIDSLTWMRIRAFRREHTFELPDGSRLLLSPAAAGEEGGAAGGGGDPAMSPGGAAGLFAALFGVPSAAPTTVGQAAMVEIVRADEPGYYKGRATIYNLGGIPVTWQHAFGETVIEPSQRVTFFLAPPTAPAPAGLVAGNAQVERAGGGTVRCRSAGPAAVQWCGASISLPQGGQVTFESLQGDGFAEASRPPNFDPPGADPPGVAPPEVDPPGVGSGGR